MKLDLVREILLNIEEQRPANPNGGLLEVQGYSSEEVRSHAILMRDRGLLECTTVEDSDKVFWHKITREGYVVLGDASREKE